MDTKNGNKEGTTAVAHKISPFLAAVKLVLENQTNPKQNKQKTIANPFLLMEYTQIFTLLFLLFSIGIDIDDIHAFS